MPIGEGETARAQVSRASWRRSLSTSEKVMEHRYFGGTEIHAQKSEDETIATMIERALRPVAASVGLDEVALKDAVERNISRRVARSAFDGLEGEGIQIRSMRVLDLGAGLGHASIEAVKRGGNLVAIEPGYEWCNVVRHRLDAEGNGVAIVGDGERLPFPDNAFDVIVSIGVLEHVRQPRVFLKEAYRVLKPGGFMFLSCENYLSFWEPHYQLRWLPLFPKQIASIYLRLHGRPSEFLLSSITYTTRPGVNRNLRGVGFQFKREANLRKKLRVLIETRLGRIVPQRVAAFAARGGARIVFGLENLRQTFTPYYQTIVGKPSSAA
jgi:SAM-dependent methyltransferase